MQLIPSDHAGNFQLKISPLLKAKNFISDDSVKFGYCNQGNYCRYTHASETCKNENSPKIHAIRDTH